jgi:hypothetical protein
MGNIQKQIRFWFPLLLILTVFILLSVFIHVKRHDRQKRAVIEWNASQTNHFLAFYTFHLSPLAKESDWSNALAKKINGNREQKVTAGRIDVVTKDLAIEVEKIKKWHEGIGQALHYGLYTGKIPTLAIITYPPRNPREKETINVIENVCMENGIELIILMPN